MNDEFLLVTLRFLATGLLHWQRKFAETGSVYPYPKDLQIGLDRLAAQSLTAGLDFPQDIPDALSWFHKPLNDWPQLQEKTLFTEDDSLLIAGQPTETCYELVVDGDVEQELTEQLILKALNQCREQKNNDDYVRFRRFLIEHPVIEMSKVVSWSTDKRNGVAVSLLRDAYDVLSPSTSGPENKHFLCSNCGWMLDWKNDQAQCIHSYCAKRTNHFRRRKECKITDFPVRLKRGIMRFVAWPGQWELKLEQDLHDLQAGLKVELWPGFDSYDLRIVFPDGEVWAVDVKDWRNPYLLAKNVKPFSETPEWHKAFWVVTNHYWRNWRGRGYGQEFGRFYALRQKEAICSMKEFLQRVQRHLEGEG